MRLAEAAFVGFFGGAAAGGAGAGLVTTAERVPGAANSTLDTAASVTAKARDLLDKAQGQRVDNDITREQYGDTMTGSTTRESQRDLDAQLRAMVDESSTKQAVWAANERKYDLPDNKIRQITVDGTPALQLMSVKAPSFYKQAGGSGRCCQPRIKRSTGRSRVQLAKSGC